MLRRTFLVSLAGASLATTAAHAQGFGGGFGGDPFVQNELSGGAFAMATSQIALQRSRNPDVRTFAQLEINEQTAVAAALGAAPGRAPLRQDQAAIVEQLSGMSGRTFDRMYIQGQIAGHRELLALNSEYAQGGSDPQARSVAIVAVPSIQTHLQILSRLQRRGFA